jgi:lipopolysaccharide/colanic/teichoic acid biosynthesis glycosyltransferase
MEKPARPYLFKYITDRLLALWLLCVFSPLYILIAVAIKLEGLFFPASRGSVLVSETRISRGKEFKLYKFRKAKEKALNRLKKKKPGTHSVTELQKNPHNLTFVGNYILKKFYLDESAQIFNVMRGDMSFVGPRPHIPSIYYSELKHGIAYEKIMRCGLTGLVAINKDMRKNKAMLDTEYFQKYSTYHPLRLLFYDMWIMLQTLALVFRAKGI